MQIYKTWKLPFDGEIDATVEKLIDDSNGLRIVLHEHKSNRSITISFPYHILYMNRDESDLAGESSIGDGLGDGNFYIVGNSELEKNFRASSLRHYDDIIHFAIVTDSDCIDILSDDYPDVAIN